MKKIIVKPIIALIISLITVYIIGGIYIDNIDRFESSGQIEKIIDHAISKTIKEDIKYAESKIEKEYYKSDEYREVVEEIMMDTFNASPEPFLLIYTESYLKELYIIYSIIGFIFILIVSGYIKDVKNCKINSK